jgi:hypothetical protein
VQFAEQSVRNIGGGRRLVEALVEPEAAAIHTAPQREAIAVNGLKAEKHKVIADSFRNVAQGRLAA